jgi:hypothetical protein
VMGIDNFHCWRHRQWGIFSKLTMSSCAHTGLP